MHNTALPALTFDEIDDLLYFTRVNEVSDLHQTIKELAQKYQCLPQAVIEACVDPETGNTVLHYCSANGFSELLQSLLVVLDGGEPPKAADGTKAAAPSVNRQNGQGNTPLHWAAYNGHLAVVKLLIGAGADMWIKNQAGHLAMFEAERADKSEVVQHLLEAGGRKVEQTGTEGVASTEDEVEVQNEEAEAASSSGAAKADADGGVDIKMREAATSGEIGRP